jgi:uncharacterized protein
MPWVRVAILATALVVVCILSYYITGSVIPTDPKNGLIFQNALLLIVLGSALLEYKFTKPADSAINGLLGCITLVTVYRVAPTFAWWVVFVYCAVVFILATTCVAVSSGPTISGWRERVAAYTYRPSVVLGKARVLFSIVFLAAVFWFYGLQGYQTAALVLFWGIFVAIWPLGVPEFLSAFRPRERATTEAVGRVVRTDWPNVVRVALDRGSTWSRRSPKVLQQSDGRQCYVVPLYHQVQEEGVLGTGLCVGEVETPLPKLTPGAVYNAGATGLTPEQMLGGEATSTLIGFVDVDSSIGCIRFETWEPLLCREGLLVWCNLGDKKVHYQITEGATKEEGLEKDRHGYQVAIASQLGIYDPAEGFVKHPWLPRMNTPVFAEPAEYGKDFNVPDERDFIFGNIPGSQIKMSGPFVDILDYHTALLGVTGSGKTELAFDMLRHAVGQGTKVVCIDLTAKYEGRLSDLTPVDLSISADLSRDLGAKLTDVETGKYGAGDEKKALNEFAKKLRDDIKESISAFMQSDADDQRLGIITLNEISNTKATIFITEIYLTCLLNYAKENPDTCPRILLVVEEAHTVMPETSTMGLGDYDSRGLVAKIAQIALQGRKYGVGLLVIAQRTATVSKSVLTQCNTLIAFSCFDDTSLGFFKNFFGEAHTAAIPNLPNLNVVVFGKGVRSQRPVIVEIPFDADKHRLGLEERRVSKAAGDGEKEVVNG